MGVYDNFADMPNAIRIEGQEITLKFIKNLDGTARITWNIPTPANGCSSENQAYDGIVITLSTSPANYLTSSPADGSYYTGDLTADFDLHAGDKLNDDNVLILAAFYNDKKTTSITITDVKDRTPYYVSAYAVDNVARYHREGVHAFSLPTGISEGPPPQKYPAMHEIITYSAAAISPQSPTGLDQNRDYSITYKMECNEYSITVRGLDALTYEDLVNAVNKQFALFDNPYKGPIPPNASTFFVDRAVRQAFVYDGYRLTGLPTTFSTVDPSTGIGGTYWLYTVDNTLLVYDESGWTNVTQLAKSPSDPFNLTCDTFWYDGTVVRSRKGDAWIDLNTIVSAVNPQLPFIPTCNTYWYNPSLSEFYAWDFDDKVWKDSLVIASSENPNELPTGYLWYNETNERIFTRTLANEWEEVDGVIYADEFPYVPEPDSIWFDTVNLKLYERDMANEEWVQLAFVSYPTDPAIRTSGDLWWDLTVLSENNLFIWDEFSFEWIPVDYFFSTELDPTTPPTLPTNTAWVNPTTNEVILIKGKRCKSINVVHLITDPSDSLPDTIWFDGKTYFRWNGTTWIDLSEVLISQDTDPFVVTNGEYWFDLVNEALYIRDGISWELQSPVSFTRDFFPIVGTKWFDTVNDTLKEWNGTAWLPADPYLYVEFEERNCKDGYEKLIFRSRKTGCGQKFEIIPTNDDLFSNLANSPIYGIPKIGYSDKANGPMYKQLGVGDDGSPDERRQLHNEIRNLFGAPSIRVELTKQQIDLALDNALLMLRKHSSYSTKRGMFFLKINAGQQIYLLSDECVGFNKIVDVTAIYRTRVGAFKTAYGNNDNFAYAALQQMYTLGTFDILTYHLTSSYIKELETLFASRIMHQWVESKRELRLYNTTRGRTEKVLLDVTIERTEQDLFTSRDTRDWIRRWAVAECKAMLAQVRGKFVTLPGPTGSTTLNSSDLQQQAETEKNELKEELHDFSMQDIVDVGMRSHFIVG